MTDLQQDGALDVSDGLTVAKAVTAAKGVFDYFKARTKSAEEAMKLMELHDAFQALRDENTHLREELHHLKARMSARDSYEQRQIGNAVVLVQVRVDGTDGPPCCPKCRGDDGDPLPLQGLSRQFRSIASHQCTSCQGTFTL